jgi:hypothetical protein
MADTDLTDMRHRLVDRTETLAAFLLGEPNRPLSGPHELRFGRKGSVSIELAVPKRGLWHDHGAGEGGDLLALIQRECRLDFAGALAWARVWLGDPERVSVPPRPVPAAMLPAEHETLSPWGRALWASAEPITPDTVAGRYLISRGCALPEPHAVRWVPSLKYGPSGGAYPAMLGLITDALDADKPLNLHRTWLAPDGSGKAAVDRPRLLLKSHRKAGGVIRLSPDDEVTARLGIGEGLETCLTVLAGGWAPVWCAIDAGNIGAFPVLAGIEALTIFADHDPAGVRAATNCAERWSAAGKGARVIVPPTPGADINDWAREARHAA